MSFMRTPLKFGQALHRPFPVKSAGCCDKGRGTASALSTGVEAPLECQPDDCPDSSRSGLAVLAAHAFPGATATALSSVHIPCMARFPCAATATAGGPCESAHLLPREQRW